MLVNYMHGTEAAIMSGLVQGTYSFALTFVVTVLLEVTFVTISRLVKQKALAIGITVVLCCALVFSGSWLVNHWAGTPEIFNTVMLGYVFGAVYCLAYTTGLAQSKLSD